MCPVECGVECGKCEKVVKGRRVRPTHGREGKA